MVGAGAPGGARLPWGKAEGARIRAKKLKIMRRLIDLVLDVSEGTVSRVSDVPGIGTDDRSYAISRPNEIVSSGVTPEGVSDHHIVCVVRIEADAGGGVVSDRV
jgi:hypothetical protein